METQKHHISKQDLQEFKNILKGLKKLSSKPKLKGTVKPPKPPKKRQIKSPEEIKKGRKKAKALRAAHGTKIKKHNKGVRDKAQGANPGRDIKDVRKFDFTGMLMASTKIKIGEKMKFVSEQYIEELGAAKLGRVLASKIRKQAGVTKKKKKKATEKEAGMSYKAVQSKAKDMNKNIMSKTQPKTKRSLRNLRSKIGGRLRKGDDVMTALKGVPGI